MALRIVRLGSPRHPQEGLRIGTVRRPPRGVPKTQFASGNWYDVWFPTLAPSVETMKLGQAAQADADAKAWAQFTRRYHAEMAAAEAQHALNLLAAMSLHGALSVGCYCADEAHCHRGLLRGLLDAKGAVIATD
jgi:uncharacterized protein YeaO (DUF488 family)